VECISEPSKIEGADNRRRRGGLPFDRQGEGVSAAVVTAHENLDDFGLEGSEGSEESTEAGPRFTGYLHMEAFKIGVGLGCRATWLAGLSEGLFTTNLISMGIWWVVLIGDRNAGNEMRKRYER